MRLGVALLASAAFACGGKGAESSGPVDPGDSGPAPTHAPGSATDAAPTSTPPNGTSSAPNDRTPASNPRPDAGALVPSSDGGSIPPPWTQNPGGTIVFEPNSVSAFRYPTICDVMNPPFMNGDQYSLNMVGQTGPMPYNGLYVGFTSPAPPVGITVMLTVQTFYAMGSGLGQPDATVWYADQTALGGGITFQYAQGTNPTEIDTGAFDAVTITILAVPTANGQPLTARIQIHFVDGKTLDETFSGALVSELHPCGSG